MKTQATHAPGPWKANVEVFQSGDCEYIDSEIWLNRLGDQQSFKQQVTLVRRDGHIYCGEILFSPNNESGFVEIEGNPPECVSKALTAARPSAEAIVRRIYAKGVAA